MKRFLALMMAVLMLPLAARGEEEELTLPSLVPVASLELMQSCPLAFSREPADFQSAAMLPDQTLVIFYGTTLSDGQTEDWMDIFAADGTQIRSQSLGTYDPIKFVFSHAQIILTQKGFLQEYYPDVATMETCYRTSYKKSGAAKGKTRKLKQRTDDAFYTTVMGDYTFFQRAHCEDEPDFTGKIRHRLSDQTLSFPLYDTTSYALFEDEKGGCLFVQPQGREALEIRQFTFDGSLHASVLTLPGDYFPDGGYTRINSAAGGYGVAYFQISVTNVLSNILTYDLEQQCVTASHPLSAGAGADFLSSLRQAGTSLMVLDGYWSESLQQKTYRLALLDADMNRTSLSLACGNCLYLFSSAQSEDIITVETDQDGTSFFLCRYRLSGGLSLIHI